LIDLKTMRLLGLVSLLAALAIVGIVASRQLQALGRAPSAAAPASTTTSPQALPEQVRRDVTKALEQGAVRRDDAAQ
jgi:hypothetical protein